ncbi:MAG: hypothetical protein IJA35_05785 [Clostridia bacterium]|nr:hypothetical protein [Clostridia bacterium]
MAKNNQFILNLAAFTKKLLFYAKIKDPKGLWSQKALTRLCQRSEANQIVRFSLSIKF